MSRTFLITGLSMLLIICSAEAPSAQDEESFVRESIISKRDAFVLSVLFPGLGQMTSGQKVKGVSLFLAEAASLVLFVNAHEDYSTKITTYNKDIGEFDKIATIGGNGGRYSIAQEMFNDLQDQKKKLDDLNTIRNTALIVAAGVYAYNIIDTILFSPSTSESRRVERTDKTRVNVSSTVIDRTPGIMLTKRCPFSSFRLYY